MPLLGIGLKARDLRKRGDDLRLACHWGLVTAAGLAVGMAADLARQATVHDSHGPGGLKGPSRACAGPRIECLARLMDDPVAQSIETGSEP